MAACEGVALGAMAEVEVENLRGLVRRVRGRQILSAEHLIELLTIMIVSYKCGDNAMSKRVSLSFS